MPIPTHVQYRGLDSSTSVQTEVDRWVGRMERSFDRVQSCAVTIEVPHRHQQHGRRFHVTIVVDVPGRTLSVSHDPGIDAAHHDVHVALRDAFRAARRQLEEHARHVRGETHRSALAD